MRVKHLLISVEFSFASFALAEHSGDLKSLSAFVGGDFLYPSKG